MSFIRLDTVTTSLLLERVANAAPLWRYFGSRLEEGAGPQGGLGETRALPSFHPDSEAMLSLVPTHGSGWFGPAAVRAHRQIQGGGRDWVQQWTAVEELSEGDTLVIRLTDDVSGGGGGATRAAGPRDGRIDAIGADNQLRRGGV